MTDTYMLGPSRDFCTTNLQSSKCLECSENFSAFVQAPTAIKEEAEMSRLSSKICKIHNERLILLTNSISSFFLEETITSYHMHTAIQETITSYHMHQNGINRSPR
ncbi:hypothetical protein LOAG_01455 [Loa loa]|uniref:Uncharacterized protein n=1 Tax=Loa loa TaxID=7209 RepID=A0A1S0U8R2_LOALO|nr:hypothetical protein LOAG_01455 [Loa loa]EFO27035.1 hypothetical protein LOAG_01455 [Loa loa]